MIMKSVTRRTMLALLAAATSSRVAGAQTSNIIKIGAIFSLSGAVAGNGLEALKGAQYAVDMLNDTGGVVIGGNKCKVQLINLDDQSDAERCVASAEKLIDEYDVPVILTSASSTNTLAILPLAEKNKRIALTFLDAAPAIISPEYKYSFRTTLSSVMNVSPAVEFLAKEKNVKTIAYIARDDDWGRSSSQVIKSLAKKMGVQVLDEEYYDTNTTDFYSLLIKIRQFNPDAVISAAEIEDGVALIKQYRELQIPSIFLELGIVWASPEFIQAAGNAVNGVYVSTGPTTTTSSELTAFKAEFLKRTGAQAQPFGITAYDNVNLIVQAMKSAGTTDPEQLAQMLHRSFEYKGLLQTYSFNNSNQSPVVINVNQIQNGAVNVISSITTT